MKRIPSIGHAGYDYEDERDEDRAIN